MSSPPKPPTTPSPASGAGADLRAPPAYSPATATSTSGQPMHPPPSPARAAAQRHVNAMSAAADPDVQAALADFAVGRVLGKGKFSQVYLVTSKSSGKKFAFKVLSKVDHRPRVMAKLRREIDILHALRDSKMYVSNDAFVEGRHGHGHGHGGEQDQDEVITLRGHPNLVTLYQAFETPSSTILLLEYIAGINLHDFVFESIRLSEGVARGLFRQLVSAVSFCHARGVVHRDLKMGNVMLILAQPPTPPLVASPASSSTHSQSQQQQQQQDPVPVGSPRRGSEPAIHLSSPAPAAPAQSQSGANQTQSRSPATPRHWPRRLELTRSYRLRFRSSIVADPIGEDSYTSPYSPHVPWMHQEMAESGGWLVKLVDFGLGSSFDPQEYRHTAVGSPGYFAPEIALGAEYVGPEVDVWSCGVVLFEMTTGMHPFSAKDLPTLKEIVVRGRFAVPHHVSPELRRTFARLMNTDASRRKNLHVLDVDAWTNVGYDGRRAAYEDPEEEVLVRYGVEVDELDYLDGTVVVVEENFGNGEGRRRSLSSPSTAVQAIAAGYGRPRTGTARTNASAPETSPGDWYLPGESSSAAHGGGAAAAAADGLLAHRTRQDTAASTQSQVQPDELAHRRELARRLRQFNASVPALRTSGGGGGIGGMLGVGTSASAHVRALEAAQQHQQQQVHQQYRAYSQQQAQHSAAASQQHQFSTASAGAAPVVAPPSRSGRHARRASILGHPGLSAAAQPQQQQQSPSQSQSQQAQQQQQQSAANALVTGVAPNVEYVTRSVETTAISLAHQQHPQHAPTSPPRAHQQRHQAQHQQRSALPPDTPRRGSAPAAATSPLPNPPTAATRAKPNATMATGAGSHPPTRAEASASMGVQLATAAAAHPALAAATVPLPVPPTVHVLPPSPAAIAAATSTAAAAPPPAPLRMRNVKKGTGASSSTSANAGGWAGWWPFTASASSGPSRNYSPPLPADHHTRVPSAAATALAAAAESGDARHVHVRRATSPVSPATSGAATAAMGTPNESTTTTTTGTSGSSGFSSSSTNGEGGYHHHHAYAVPTLERGRNGGDRTKSKPWYSRLFGAGKSSSGKAAR